MTHGRQLRLFLSDGTSSGPRFYEIVNRTIQAIVIPANRIAEVMSDNWKDFQKPGVYLVSGATEEGSPRLYIGKGENTAKRVQAHPEKLDFEVESLLLITSKDQNLNQSQVGWLESTLILAADSAKKIELQNVQKPTLPDLGTPELATVNEFKDDLILIAQTAGFDFFTAPKITRVVPQIDPVEIPAPNNSPEFFLNQPQKGIEASGLLSDDGFVVKAGSDSRALPNDSFKGTYADLRLNLIEKGVLKPHAQDPEKLTFTIDYAFKAPSPAAAVVVGNNYSGRANWKTTTGQTLGDYLDSLTSED